MKRAKPKERSSVSEKALKDQLKVCGSKHFKPDFDRLANQKRTYRKLSKNPFGQEYDEEMTQSDEEETTSESE